MNTPVMRAKLRAISVTTHHQPKPEGDESPAKVSFEELTFMAVGPAGNYPSDGSDENNSFALWTPSADLKMSVTNPALFGRIEQHQEFYVDFTLVTPTGNAQAGDPDCDGSPAILPHQQRVIDEKAELDTKLEALRKFIAGSPIFLGLSTQEQERLVRQESCMGEYSGILSERIAAFNGEPAFELVPADPQQELVRLSKQFRKDLDENLQRMKGLRDELAGTSLEGVAKDPREVVPNLVLSIRHVEDAIMRQGMFLKAVGNPNPYPTSYNPDSPVVEPTADGLKL